MNKRVKILVLSAFAGFLTATAGNAQSISDCDPALIRSTYNRTERQFNDWRLAERVDQSTYNQIKQEAGLNAKIFGVSVGADWNKFQENIASHKTSRDESFTSDDFRNVAWTGLEPNAVTAYSNCLLTVVATRKSLVLLPKTATASDVSFEVRYKVVGTGPNPLQLAWDGAEAAKGALPREIYGGEQTVVVRRPSIQSTLVVNGLRSGLSDAVVLTPFRSPPPPPPPPPPSPASTECSIDRTASPFPQVGKGGSTTWQCGVLESGNYKVEVSIYPTVSPPIWARVEYDLSLEVRNGSAVSIIALPMSAGRIIDLNNPKKDFPPNFSSNGPPVFIHRGAVGVKLNIAGVANHCCFHTTKQNDGTMVMPEQVSIRLTRVP